MGELVRLDIANGIATITLDSQHNRNALSRQLVRELLECLDDAEAADPRAIVLRHEGPAFCAGADLKERATDNANNDASSEAAGPNPFVGILQRLMDAKCPTIAAVHGAVRAGGTGLMASCDLIVVDESVSFALTEVRIGVAIAIISVPIFRRVPANKLAAAIYTGETFDAHYAREIGLVTHVTDDVVATVDQLCAGVLEGSPAAVAMSKEILRRIPALDRDAAFDEMQALSAQLFRSPDAAEGMAAFREKRKPSWAP